MNGEPVDIHMKLGESGEAFFVEQCDDNDDDDENQVLANDSFMSNNNDDFVKYDEQNSQSW